MNNLTPNKWIPSADVRGYIYKVLTAAGPLLAAYGLLSANDFSLWLALAGTILGAGGNALASANTPKHEAPEAIVEVAKEDPLDPTQHPIEG